jgi:hypothetical protein
MASFTELSRRTLEDLRRGRHREAYALFLIGVALAVLGLAGVADVPVLLSAILLALTFLVFHTATESSGQRLELDEVLRSREDYGPFSSLLQGTHDLRIYGPTAVNVLVNSADIRKYVLKTGGIVKVIVQGTDQNAISLAAAQLDDNMDFESTLRSSLATLDKLSADPGFSYRMLGLPTGFSLIVVNATDSDGYVIFESHGFKDENITDRMHIVIKKRESPRWFLYWVARFDAMWEAAKPPSAAASAAPEPL